VAILRWGEPHWYRLALRGDLGLRLLTAGGAWGLATGVFCALFAINVNPPGLGVAAFLGAVFGLGPAMLALFFRKPHVSGRIRADDDGLHRTRVYASVTEMWAENTDWPYEAISECLVVPAAALGRSFSLLLLGLDEGAEMVALPQRFDRDALVRLLAAKGVTVRVGEEVPAEWRRPLAAPLATVAASLGLVALLAGGGFYLLRPDRGHASASRPSFPEVAQRPPLPGSRLPSASAPVRQDRVPQPKPKTASTSTSAEPAPEPPAPRGTASADAPRPGPGGAGPQNAPATAVGGPGGVAALRGGARPGMAGGEARPGQPPGAPPVAGVPGYPAGAPLPAGAPAPWAPGAPQGGKQPGDSELVGGPGGFPFRAAGTAPVVGFRYGLGSWAGEAALSALDPVHERQPARPDTAMARPGYAVGALKVDAGTLVNAVQIVFMKAQPDGRLDPKDSYTSDWLGRPSGREPKVVGGKGQAVVGVHGRRGAVIDAIGLVLAPAE
jgi:hypothetical protein